MPRGRTPYWRGVRAGNAGAALARYCERSRSAIALPRRYSRLTNVERHGLHSVLRQRVDNRQSEHYRFLTTPFQ
jgi:hypothetical protein